MNEKQKKQIIEKAREGMRNAYSIVHNFPVGAAVLTKKGDIYQGCNTESVISGMGICAERSAIDHAVAHGEYVYEAIAIVSKLEEPVKPCGMCLQYISEFSQIANKDIKIIMAGSKGKIIESSVYKMLPKSFGPRDSGINLSRYRK